MQLQFQKQWRAVEVVSHTKGCYLYALVYILPGYSRPSDVLVVVGGQVVNWLGESRSMEITG